MQEKNNDNFCRSGCLRSIPTTTDTIKIGKKKGAWNAYGDDKFFYFPIQTGAPAADRLLGSYENRHREALELLKCNPVPHVVRVEELCGCAYKIDRLSGRIFFDADMIPEALRASQHELLGRREVCLKWADWRKWMTGLADGLLGLHKLGLAHGDVTAFNAIVDEAGNAIWIDLENLNFDTEQRDNDTVSFVFYVLLFSYELLLEVPADFIAQFENLVRSATTGDEILSGLISILKRTEPLRKTSLQANQLAVFEFTNHLAAQATTKGDALAGCFARQLFRGAVYFQKNFLWLVNYHMKALHSEKRGVFEFLDQLKQLTGHIAGTNLAVESLTKELSKKGDELKAERERFAELTRKSQEDLLELTRLRPLETEMTGLKENNELLRQLHATLKQEQMDEIEIRKQVEAANLELAENNRNLAVDRDNLKTDRDNLKTDRDNLKTDRDNLAINRDNLKADYDNLTEVYKQKAASQEESARKLADCERQLAELNQHSATQVRNEAELRKLLDRVKQQIRNTSENSSFRAAKFLQIMHNPALCGASGKLGVLRKLLASKFGGKPFAEDYLALSNVLNVLDDGLREMIRTESIAVQKPAPTLLDDSVLISVVLPIYNHAYLAAASIESIQAQTYRNWELIIVNDGSSDNLDEVVAPYLSDKRIRYLKQPNQKLPKALTNGFSFATGELLTWTSADNHMRPEMLERLSAFLRSHEDVAMVYADYMTIDEKGEPMTAEWFRPQNKFSPNDAELHLPRTTEMLNVVRDNFIGASFMYRRSALEIIGEYDPQLGVEDYDYWMRINSLLKIAHLGTDEILYEYRVHDNSLSGKAAELRILEKGIRLMEYEKERFAFYCRPFEIYGSYRPGNFDFDRRTVEFRDGMPAGPAAANDKRMLLLRGKELNDYTLDELGRFNFTGVFFEADEENEACKAAFLIRAGGVKCFARPGSPSARRLAVLVPDLVECGPEEFGRLTLAAANNRIFYGTTHNADEIHRTLPQPPGNMPEKIIILLEQIGIGGMEQVAFDMAESFVRHGKTVMLCCVKDFTPDLKLPRGVEFRPLDRSNPEDDFRRLLAERKFEAVIAHYTTRCAKVTSEVGVPFFQVIHNNYVWFGDNERQQYSENDCYTTGYIAVSANVAWYAMERLQLPPEKMSVIENGVNFVKFVSSEDVRKKRREELGFAPDSFVLLNPASCYAVKGQLNLIHAFADAYEKNPKLRLILAGNVLEEYYAKTIRTVIAEQHLEKAVVMGFYDDMASLYNAADAVVFASFWEGCSLGVAEAVHMRRPILSSRVGDIERQTGGVNCVLYDLPFRYLTDLTEKNYGGLLSSPNPQIINSLTKGIAALTAGDYPKSDHWGATERPADEVYQRYLKALHYFAGGLPVTAIRHNI